MRISLSQYILPHVVAISAHRILPNSANQPIIITGIETASGLKNEYVVKLNASERMHKEARLRELMGAFIALEMELDVVEPAIIEITVEFAENQKGQTYYLKTANSLGYNVGSKLIDKFLILQNNISLTPSQEIAAQNIFAFDTLIQNNDRTYEKPNMITDGTRLVMLDHELAFGFHLALPFLRNNEPWKFDENDLVWINKHCLLKRLKGKYGELENFSFKMENLNSNFWNRAKELIPNEWYDEEIFETIKSHINLILQNKNEFISNLKILMS